jgi:hypothetical protein
MSFRRIQKLRLFINLSPFTVGASVSLQQDLLLTSLSNSSDGMGNSEARSSTTGA